MDTHQSQELTDLPLSQETFHMMWDQLISDANNGLVLQNPVEVNIENVNLDEAGDNNVIQQEQYEFQVEQLQFEPQRPALMSFPTIPSFTSESSFLAELNAALPSQPQPTVANERSPGSSTMPSSIGYVSATETNATPPPLSFTPPLPNQPLLPSNTEYSGEFDFQIDLGQPTSQASKSVSWTYSPSLNKLFVDRDKPCPIQIKTSHPPPANSYIRVLPIFKQAENLAEVVSRCPNHIGTQEEPSANHLVLCSDPNTQYFTDPLSCRHSLCVPYNCPQVGTEFSKYLFTFRCFISCVGGLNRRKIQLVFTLEDENSRVLGRRALDVRVCACPGRDRKAEERQSEKSKASTKKPVKRGATKQVTSSVGLTSFTKKRKVDDEVFTITVQGREKYELLMKIKESLDLMDFVTPSQVSQCRQQQAQLNQQLQVPNGVPPNVARVSSFQATPPSTTATQGNALGHPNPTPIQPTPSLTRSSTFPQQQQQQQQQNTQQQQQYPLQQTNLPMMPQQQLPSTSTALQRQDTTICKDEADGPNPNIELDAIPTSQGFGLPGNLQLSPPCQTQNHSAANPDVSIGGWLGRLGYKQYADIFHQKGVHTVEQLEEISLEDLAHMPQQARETLWRAVLDLKNGLHLGTPSMARMGSGTSTASLHSSGSLSGSQVYRATRFTLKQVLSFKVEKEDD